MRRSIPILRGAAASLILVILLAPAVVSAQMSIDDNGTTVYLGRVSPDQPHDKFYGQHFVIHSPVPYSLLADADAQFTTTGPPAQTMPIDRLKWRDHRAAGAYTAFTAGMQTIAAGLPPSAPTGTSVVLDYSLQPTFGDLPTPEDGSDPYRASITYTVTAGTIDPSFAYPNPFSPDGDGVNDDSIIHWYQDVPRVVDVLVYSSDGSTLLRTITEERSLGVGEQRATFDGRDNQQLLMAEGEYLYRVVVSGNQTTDPGLVLASGLVAIEVGVGVGTATVTGNVTSGQGGGPVANANVELFRAGGSSAATDVTATDGVYNFTNVAAGLFYLEIDAPLHFPYRSPEFEVADGGTVTFNVQLVHNHSLTIKKTADGTDYEPGDVVGYTVDVTASGVEDVTNVVVTDHMPHGLHLIPGSVRINRRKDPRDSPGSSTIATGRTLRFELGTLVRGAKARIYYEATVAPGTAAGKLVNSARATGTAAGQAVSAGPTQAPIFVNDGDTGDRSLLFGRVYLDTNGNRVFDKGDKPLPKSRVIIDDGTVIYPDALGRYSVKGLRPGTRAVMVVATEATEVGKELENGPSRVVLRDIRYGAPVRLDFPVTRKELDDFAGTNERQVTIGVADATLRLGRSSGLGFLELTGRLAGFTSRDLGDGYRLTAYADTDHEPREELGIGQSELQFQPETGDDSTLRPSVPDKIGLRLDAPWGHALLGRGALGLGSTDLVNGQRSYFGVEAQVGGKKWSVRGLAGVTDSIRKLDVIADNGTTGPFPLSAAPVVPRSERVVLEARNAAGETTARTELLREADYTIDNALGVLFLARPIPLSSTQLESFFILVQYEYAPVDAELGVAPIAAGRAQVELAKNLRVGGSFVAEDAEPTHRSVAGIDVTYTSKKVDVVAEAALSGRGNASADQLESDDPSAFRARAIYRPLEKGSAFAYINKIGGAFTERVDFRARFPTAQRFDNMPPPAASLMTPTLLRAQNDGNKGFPFILQSTPDTLEYGAGVAAFPRRDVIVSAGRFDVIDEGGRGHRNHTDYVSARFAREGFPSLFLASTGITTGPEHERAFVLGSKYETSDWNIGSELRRDVTRRDGFEDVDGTGALLRGQFTRYPKFRPGVLLLGFREANSEETVSETKGGALGAESKLGKIRLFGYGFVTDVLSRANDDSRTVYGAFAGGIFEGRRVRGSTRLDLSEDSNVGTRLNIAGRLRFRATDEITLFGDSRYTVAGDDLPFWNHTAGAAYRPLIDPVVYGFLKYRDRSASFGADPIVPRRHNQLLTADVVFPFGDRNMVGTRLAGKRVSSAAGYIRFAVVAEQLTWNINGRYDLILGGRYAHSSVSGHTYGLTTGFGYRFLENLRLVLGVNSSRDWWAFEADDSFAGMFINITGVYGSAGAPAVMR